MVAASLAVFLIVVGAHSANAKPPEGESVAAITPQAGGAPPADTSAATDEEDQNRSNFAGSVTVQTDVGIGTFAPEPHSQSLVSTTFLASGSYRLTPELHLSAVGSLTWFNVNDFYTPLPDNEALLSDISFGISHSRLYHHVDSGFNLSASFRVLLPTSLASQFQNRLITLLPGVAASIPFGDFRLNYGFSFGKFFASSSVPTVDCSDFPNPEDCVQGRNQNSALGFETERRGGEVWLPGSGMNSFFVANNLSLSWSPTDRLSFGLSFGIFTYFGLRSLPVDEFSTKYAKAGRQQRDRLISSVSVSYQLFDSLSISSNLVTDASQPFGARGDSFPVIFDFSRAATNNTSISLALTGTF